MNDERKAFEAWATDYFGENVSYPEACFDAWLAALRAQPAEPFKKLDTDQLRWIANSHGIDVRESSLLGFYNDLISTAPARPDHSELMRRCLDDEFGVTSKALRKDIEDALGDTP